MGYRKRASRSAAIIAATLSICMFASGCAQSGSGQAGSGQPPAANSAGATDAIGASGATARPLANPRSYIGPSTARLSNPDITPITDRPRPQLPATVTDAQGTKVTVRSADRILALDRYGTLSATVFGLGLGGKLVGRDESSGFPAAAHLPVVTRAHQLNAEAILALHPSVLITDTTLGPWDVVLQIRASGVPVVVVDPQRSLSSISVLIDEVSAALGVGAEGDLLSARVATEVAAQRCKIDKLAPADPAKRLRIVFLYVRGQAGAFYLFGKGSGADSLIDALDAVDVATQAGLDGYTPLNAEALAKLRPDLILMMTDGLESVGGVSGALRLPGVAETPAGLHHRIVDMSDFQVLSFGPLTPRVLDALAHAVYEPQGAGG